MTDFSIEMTVDQKVPGVDLTPRRATAGSAGYDLRLCSDVPVTLLSGGDPVLLPTGVRLDMRKGEPMCAMIMPRSGLGHKQGFHLGNTIGLIDQDYLGEISVSAFLRPKTPLACRYQLTIQPGDRIAQLVFLPCFMPVFGESHEFVGERGEGSFGSTGLQ